MTLPSPDKGPRPTENRSATHFWVTTHQLRTTVLATLKRHASLRLIRAPSRAQSRDLNAPSFPFIKVRRLVRGPSLRLIFLAAWLDSRLGAGRV